MSDTGDSIPRRARLDLNTPAELAIREAAQVVEAAGAHPLLTDAVVLLGRAREKVADFVDGRDEVGGQSRSALLREVCDRIERGEFKDKSPAEQSDLYGIRVSLLHHMRRLEEIEREAPREFTPPDYDAEYFEAMEKLDSM